MPALPVETAAAFEARARAAHVAASQGKPHQDPLDYTAQSSGCYRQGSFALVLEDIALVFDPSATAAFEAACAARGVQRAFALRYELISFKKLCLKQFQRAALLARLLRANGAPAHSDSTPTATPLPCNQQRGAAACLQREHSAPCLSGQTLRAYDCKPRREEVRCSKANARRGAASWCPTQAGEGPASAGVVLLRGGLPPHAGLVSGAERVPRACEGAVHVQRGSFGAPRGALPDQADLLPSSPPRPGAPRQAREWRRSAFIKTPSLDLQSCLEELFSSAQRPSLQTSAEARAASPASRVACCAQAGFDARGKRDGE